MNRHAMPSPTQKPSLSLLAALSLALAACSGGGAAPAQDPPLAGADIGGPFELVDQHGNTVRWEEFAGRYRIVYFGFTYCPDLRSEEHTSELQSLMRISYAVFCLKKKTHKCTQMQHR